MSRDLHPGTILYYSCQLWAVCAKVIAAINAQLWIEAVFIASLKLKVLLPLTKYDKAAQKHIGVSSLIIKIRHIHRST